MGLKRSTVFRTCPDVVLMDIRLLTRRDRVHEAVEICYASVEDRHVERITYFVR
jgi:hypothetical protein